MADDDELERRARSIARRRTANVLLAVVCILLLSDVALPDSQFHLDPVAFPLLIAAVLLLNDVSVPWSHL